MSYIDLFLNKTVLSLSTYLLALVVLLTLIHRPEAWSLLNKIFERAEEMRVLWFRVTFFQPNSKTPKRTRRKSSVRGTAKSTKAGKDNATKAGKKKKPEAKAKGVNR